MPESVAVREIVVDARRTATVAVPRFKVFLVRRMESKLLWMMLIAHRGAVAVPRSIHYWIRIFCLVQGVKETIHVLHSCPARAKQRRREVERDRADGQHVRIGEQIHSTHIDASGATKTAKKVQDH